MKRYSIKNLLVDYDFVNRVLDNPENKRRHILGLRMMIHNFEMKYSEFYLKHREYFIALRLKLDNLRIKFRTN